MGRGPRPSASGWGTLVLLLLLPALLVAATADAGEAAGPPRGAAEPPCQRLLIPAYFYPYPGHPSLWDRAIAGRPTVKFLIANPANGPGREVDPRYSAVIGRARAAGVTVLGYVYTSYADRPAAQVRVDIDRWRRFYGVKSIFIDEVSSGAGDLRYYRRLAKQINEYRRSTIVLNPGTIPDERYLGVGDVVVVFEGPATAYANADVPAWVRDHPAKRFAHLIYAVDDATAMAEVIAVARSRNAGHVYVTDDVLPNPWDTLPPYFSEELTEAAAGCDR